MRNKGLLLFFFLVTMAFLQGQETGIYLQKGHEHPINSLQFDRTGRILLSGDETVYLTWDFFSHQETGKYAVRPSTFEEPVRSDSLNGFHSFLNDNASKIICLRDGKKTFVIPKSLYDFSGLALNADRSAIAYINQKDDIVFIRRASRPGEMFVFNLAVHPTALAFHPMLPHLLAIGLRNGRIITYDISERKIIFELSSALFPVTAIRNFKDNGITVLSNENSAVLLPDDNPLKIGFDRLFTNRPLTARTLLLYNKSPLSYYWSNYNILRYDGDSSTLFSRFDLRRASDKWIAPAIKYAGILINVQATIQALLQAPYLTFRSDYIPDLQNAAGNIFINNHRSITAISTATGKRLNFLAYGNDDLIYHANAKFLAAWRPPYYLTAYHLEKNRNPQVMYCKEAESVHMLGDSDSLIVQQAAQFKIIKLQPSPVVLATRQGRFVNYDDGQVFYTRDSQLYCTSDSHFIPVPLLSGLYLKACIPKNIAGRKRFYLYYNFGTMTIVNDSASVIASTFFYNGGDFITITPDNYFHTSSRRLIHNVLLQDSSGSHMLGQTEIKYNRPDIIAERLGTVDTNTVNLLRLAYQKRTGTPIDHTEFPGPNLFPEAKWTNWDNLYFTREPKLVCQLRFSAPRSLLTTINVTVNNQPLWGGKGLNISDRKLSVLDTTVTVSLANGDNYIRLVCFNQELSSNKSASYFVRAEYEVHPIVRYLGIGAGRYLDTTKNLDYAAQDVQHLYQQLQKQFGARVVGTVLVDEQVSKVNVLEALNGLLHSDPNDMVIIYFSGHGLLSSSLDLLLATYATDSTNREKQALPYSAVDSLISAIPSHKKIVFLDACHSGFLDKSLYTDKGTDTSAEKEMAIRQEEEAFYLSNELYGNTTEENAAIVLAAARGNQYAKEGTKWNSGVFSFCLTEGLFGRKADKNKDHHITISELKQYLNTEVTRQSNGHQIPMARKENAEFDWTFF